MKKIIVVLAATIVANMFFASCGNSEGHTPSKPEMSAKEVPLTVAKDKDDSTFEITPQAFAMTEVQDFPIEKPEGVKKDHHLTGAKFMTYFKLDSTKDETIDVEIQNGDQYASEAPDDSTEITRFDHAAFGLRYKKFSDLKKHPEMCRLAVHRYKGDGKILYYVESITIAPKQNWKAGAATPEETLYSVR